MERIYPHPFFAREGWVFMGIAFAIALLVQIFAGGFLAFIFWLLFFFVAQFFRDPAREMTDDEKAVVAPVDGRVIKVEEAVCPYTGEQTKLVSIFMNVFNVHSQKTPVAGRIEKIEYFHGRYLNASLDKASDLNERNAVTVVTEDGQRVCFVQIAGLVARRILCYRMVGDTVSKGERYGFIRFGSRVDVYLPMSAQVLVSIGEKTTGVETVIARLGEPVEVVAEEPAEPEVKAEAKTEEPAAVQVETKAEPAPVQVETKVEEKAEPPAEPETDDKPREAPENVAR